MKVEKNRVILDPFRICYVYVDKPQIDEDADKDDPGKYKVTVLIPKDEADDDFFDGIDKAVDEAIDIALEKKKISSAKGFDVMDTIHDGDKKAKDPLGIFEDHYYINVKSSDIPGLVDARNKPMIDRTGIYSGCYARVSMTVYAYEHKKSGKGIGFALNNIMFWKDGERLAGGGGRSAEEDFEEFKKGGRDDDDRGRGRGRGRDEYEEDDDAPRNRRGRDDDDDRGRGRREDDRGRGRDDDDRGRGRGRR